MSTSCAQLGREPGCRETVSGCGSNMLDYLQLPAVPHDLVEVVWTLERYRHPVAVLDGEKSKAVNGSYAFRSLNLSNSITIHIYLDNRTL